MPRCQSIACKPRRVVKLETLLGPTQDNKLALEQIYPSYMLSPSGPDFDRRNSDPPPHCCQNTHKQNNTNNAMIQIISPNKTTK